MKRPLLVLVRAALGITVITSLAVGASPVARAARGAALESSLAQGPHARSATRAADVLTSPEVAPAVHSDVSPPLGSLQSKPHAYYLVDKPHRMIPSGPNTAPAPDGALQTSAGPAIAATAGLAFAGVGNGDYGFTPNAAPPDTNGAVGATQYVQWVNESFAVFDKTTGAIAAGFPKAGNTLWTGFGGGCEVNNDGDPIVQYDKAANRWVLTQFSVTNPSTYHYLQCVAVSTTSDATGTY